MNVFFEPNGVAVVGASPEASGGRNLLCNLTLGYKGPVYAVNPKHHEILGFKCYAKVSDINGPLDLALIFVPAGALPDVLDDCVQKGVRGAIIESGGFAEVGPEGRTLQDRCIAIARKGRMRLWGPNCMGLIDISKGYVFSFIPTEAIEGLMNPGGVSFIVQSGFLSAGFIITLMRNKTLGLAKVCSIGNRSDIEETELFECLLKDPLTRVICLYLESFVKGRRFVELATSTNKPIVVLKGGRTPAGASASASHTASLAGNDELIRSVLKQARIRQADDFFEMADMARALEKDFHLHVKASAKPRIAVLSFSGAAGIVTADHIEKYDMTLAPLSPETRSRLEELSPPWMPVKNPVDFWPAVEKHGAALTYKHGMKALHDDPQVDGIIVHLNSEPGTWSIDMKEIMLPIGKLRKPILFWVLGSGKNREDMQRTLEEDGWPVFYEIGRTVRVMAALFEQSGNDGLRVNLKISTPELSITHFLDTLASQGGKEEARILDEYEAKKWLRALGLKVVREVIVQDLDEATKAANEIGYPVVLKGRIQGKVHKTEAGLVKLNLCTPDQIRSAYQEILGLGTKPQAFLIQPMLQGNLELIVGFTKDPQFGNAMLLGLGGVWTEVYKDVVFRLPPLREKDVLDMVAALRGQVLLKGFRGSKPVNIRSLTDWLIKLGWLAVTFDNIQEIDVNPLLIIDGEPVAIDVTIVFRSHSSGKFMKLP
jgi:acyl-CoA synthetase (NDP forming)